MYVSEVFSILSSICPGLRELIVIDRKVSAAGIAHLEVAEVGDLVQVKRAASRLDDPLAAHLIHKSLCDKLGQPLILSTLCVLCTEHSHVLDTAATPCGWHQDRFW